MKKNLLAISLITLGSLYGVLAAIIILAFAIAELPISIGILLSLAIIVIQFFIAPNLNDFVFKHFYKTKFDYELPEYLKEFISESCAKHKMKYPKIGFIDDGSPNAFTYGRTKNDARVVITRGILDLLNEEEAKAVVAHELGHAVHHDMIFMTVAQIVPLLLYYVYELLLGTRNGSSSGDSDSKDYGAMLGMIAYVLYIVSQYIILWLSRTREYYADSFSLEETKNPTALANALVKIGFGLSAGNKQNKSKVSEGNALGISNAKISKGVAIGSYNNGGVSKENIINAMKWEMWNVWAKFQELNSTHPLISNRLIAISDRCEEFGQTRYIIFNETKPESYLGDFFKELAIASAPIIILILFFIFFVIFIEDNLLMVLGIFGILLVSSLFLKLNYTHKDKEYRESNVAELLSEIKVSNVTSIPCILKGTVIGRGNPGCIFNEDFVLQDETGIIFLDYTQPLYVLEKFFALFKSEENFNKEVIIKGWYRRGVVPYVEIYSMEVDGKEKKCHTYKTVKVFYVILMLLAIFALVSSFLA